jgi:glycine cleavage system H protein
MNIPSNLKYTKDHEWVKIEGEIATIGITHFAQGELGDIVYVDVDTLDETVEKDAVFGSVEAVKTVSDLLMPLTGEVTAFNELLEDEPEKVNSDPYGDGWMIKISIADESQIADLLSPEDYKELIGAA